MRASSPAPWDQAYDNGPTLSKRARDLADEIFARIADQRYPLGTRLPAEREVARSFSVSRDTVRKALSLLEHHGLIERHAGSGSVVCYRPDPQDLANGALAVLNIGELKETTSPLEYCVVRSIVEPEIVRLAVLNMTSRDIDKMNQIQERLDLVTSDGEAFGRLDDELRQHLAECTRNPLLSAIFGITLNVGQGADWAIKGRQALSPGRIRDGVARNRSLCAAMSRRHVEAAVEQSKIALADIHQELIG